MAGQIYYNTTDSVLYLYTGAAWVSLMGDITDVQGSTIKVGGSGLYVDLYTPVSGTIVSRKFEQTGVSVGTTPGTQTITHNLNSRSVTVRVYDDTTYEELYCEVKHATLNTVTLAANGATRTVRVVVEG